MTNEDRISEMVKALAEKFPNSYTNITTCCGKHTHQEGTSIEYSLYIANVINFMNIPNFERLEGAYAVIIEANIKKEDE